jgi:hypothetical protein
MIVAHANEPSGWLLLVFSLPAKNASQRVEIWRKLRRYGVVALKSAGYVLPKNPVNEERLQWLATQIRKHKGEASVAQVTAIDHLPASELARMFVDARAKEYEVIAKELSALLRSNLRANGTVGRLRRRFQEIAERDFFPGPARHRVEQLFARIDAPSETTVGGKQRRKAYLGKTWVTRPRPGIDRVSSAWLIRRFIDPNATFAFANDADSVSHAVPFDMFAGKGFSHRGDDCTFETLIKEFGITDEKVASISHGVHDADLADEKFGRTEGLGLDRVLIGWASQGISDDELLRRGMEMIEGWYQSL